MSYKIIKIKKYKDEKLHVYLRNDSRFWLCRFYADGKYKVKTTGETEITNKEGTTKVILKIVQPDL